MSVRAFTLDTGNYYDSGYYNDYSSNTNAIARNRAYRNTSAASQKTLVRNIAAGHNSELKEAYEYLEDGNISAFQGIIDGIVSSESTKQRTYNVTDEEIASAVESAYENVIGADYDSTIASTKQNSFSSGFNQNLFFGLLSGDAKSAAEYSAQRRGTEVNGNEIAKKNLGKVAGVVTTVGASSLAIGAITKIGVATVGKSLLAVLSAHPIAWAVGLGIAAAATIAAINKK